MAVYLDHNATTPLKPTVAEAMAMAMGAPGNPSSIHSFGRAARKLVETARHQVAQAVNATPEDVIFTSGATEADNAALRHTGMASVLTTATEHDAILQARDGLITVAVDGQGLIDLAALDHALSAAPKPALVSVMLANNETGVIQPLAEISALVRHHGAFLHCDAVQALGKIPIDIQALGIDLMSLSAHKCGGPSGVGALVATERLEPSKWQFGGGQEKRRRPGTENLIGIVGFGAAAAQAIDDMPHITGLGALRDGMEDKIKAGVPVIRVMGADAPRLPNTSNMVLPAVPAQTQVMALDLSGFAVSSGSACSSGRVDPSHVILAMTGDRDLSACALRISMGWDTKPADIDGFVAAYIRMAQKQLAKLSAA
ncbi:MAG: cysteine desulfurase family protein [Pseudomonadota bacterium]